MNDFLSSPVSQRTLSDLVVPDAPQKSTMTRPYYVFQGKNLGTQFAEIEVSSPQTPQKNKGLKRKMLSDISPSNNIIAMVWN